MATTYDQTAAVRNIVMDQGSDLVVNFAITSAEVALNMTGYDLRLQVRRTYQDTTTLINCTLANSKLAWINQAGGTFKLDLAATDTSSIRFLADEDVIEGVYDIEIIDTLGNVSKPCKGSFSIYREVTR